MADEQLERLVVGLSADIKSYENALAKASGITRKELQNIKKEASGVENATVVAFQRANRGVQEFAKGTQGVERGISGFRTQIQQAAFQIGDFAVQVAGGTKATTALAQQLPQLLGGFGVLGAVLGAGVAVGIPLITAALAALGNEAVPLSERVKTLGDALSAVKEAAELQSSSIDDLTKKYGEADAAVQKLIASTVQQALLDATQQVRELSSAFAEFTDRTQDFASGSGLETADMASLLVDPLNRGLQEIVRTFDVTEEQARRLQDAFQGVRDAASQGPDAAFQALVNLLEVLQSSTDETGALSRALTETSKTVRDLADRMGQVRGAVDDVTTGVDAITAATGNAVNAAVGLADAWGRVAQSSAVAAQMAAAAAAAGGARSAPGSFATTSPTGPSVNPNDYPTYAPPPTAADFPTFGYAAPPKISGGGRKSGGGGGGISEAAKAQIDEQKRVADAVKDGIREVARAQEELRRQNEQTAESLADVFIAGIEGADSLEDSLKSLAQQMAKTFITRGFEGLLNAGGGGGILGSIGSLLTGARAAGGPVAAGGRYLVGERGPEIFVPNSSGNIIPNSGTSGRIQIDLGPDLEARFMDGAARQSVQISRSESNKVRRDVPRLTEQAQRRFS